MLIYMYALAILANKKSFDDVPEHLREKVTEVVENVRNATERNQNN